MPGDWAEATTRAHPHARLQRALSDPRMPALPRKELSDPEPITGLSPASEGVRAIPLSVCVPSRPSPGQGLHLSPMRVSPSHWQHLPLPGNADRCQLLP